MTRSFLALLSALLFIPLGGAVAQVAYVPNASSNDVSVVNTVTNTVTATVPVGFSPRGVAVSPDGSRVYITNTNSGTVSVIDTASNTVIATVTVGGLPVGVAVAGDGSRAYVVNNNSSSVSVINAASNTVTATVAVGAFPRRIALSPDGTRAYVTRGIDAVRVIDTTSNTAIATVTVTGRPEGLVVSPDGTRVYVARYNGNSVSAIDTATNLVSATVNVGVQPYGVAVSANGSRVYVANEGSNNVSVIDTNTNAVVNVAVGTGPRGVALSQDGSRLYVANGGSATVSVISTATNAVIGGAISVGSQPWAIAISSAVASIPAGVVISDTTPVPLRYASEINASAGTPVTLTSAAGNLNLSSALGYSFSQGEVRYARIECPAHVRFNTGSTVEASDAAATALGAINGLGTNVITFSITANTSGLTATDTVTVTGDRGITSAADAICAFSLYDNPSEAQAGGTNGRIVTASGAYLSFVPSWQLVADPVFTSAADVEANPAYTAFVASGDTTTTRAGLSELTFGLTTPTPLRPDGTAITLADLMATGATGTTLRVTGDFGAAANATGEAFTGAALNRVFLATDDTCTTLATAASALTATTATFNVGASAFTDDNLCLQANGTTAIPAADYTAQVLPVAASAAYTVSASANTAAGRIVRNGVELQAPLVQLPAGFVSRVALTNTGSVSRAFTWRFVPAADSTTTGATTGTGMIPANGLVVIALNDALGGFGTTPPRGTFIVTASAPSTAIQGLYQIVNLASGSLSNHVMVRPGTN